MRKSAGFHISNLGRFGDRLKPYADLDGYVPERGDEYAEFEYEEPNDFAEDRPSWIEFVDEAVRATEQAQQDARDWLTRSSSRTAKKNFPKRIKFRGATYQLVAAEGPSAEVLEERRQRASKGVARLEKRISKNPLGFGEEDLADLIEVVNDSKEQIAGGSTQASKGLAQHVSSLDTVVRDEIPPSLWNWIFPPKSAADPDYGQI